MSYGKYVWVISYQTAPSDDQGIPMSVAQWVDIGDIVPAQQNSIQPPPSNAPPAPGEVVRLAGFIHSYPLNLWGPVYVDSVGLFYGTMPNGGIEQLIGNRADGQLWTAQNIAAEIGATATASAQAAVANASKGFLGDLLSNPLFQVAAAVAGAYAAYTYFGVSMPVAAAPASTGAGTVLDAASVSLPTAGTWVSSADLPFTALEASGGTITSLSTIGEAQSALIDYAQQASMQADEYAAQAANAAEVNVADPALQAAAQQAQSAASTLKTAANAATTLAPTVATPTTAASLLNNLKTLVGVAGSALAVVKAVSGTRTVTPFTTGQRYNANGQLVDAYGNPVLTQGVGTGTNSTMLLLLAGVAAVVLTRGK